MREPPIHRTFMIILRTVVFLCLLCFGAAIWLAAKNELSAGAMQLLDTCTTCWKIGFGAIVGLIAGKATLGS